MAVEMTAQLLAAIKVRQGLPLRSKCEKYEIEYVFQGSFEQYVAGR
jgi:hypothetical protein